MRNYRSIAASLVVLAISANAHAATLSMRFAGGGNEVTLLPGESALIEVVIMMGSADGGKAPSRLTAFDMRFDVGAETTNPGVGPYVVDGSTALAVASASTSAYPNRSTGVDGPFNGDFLLSGGDLDLGHLTGAIPGAYVIADFAVRHDAAAVEDVKFVFRVADALPTLYIGAMQWANRFGYTAEIGRNNFLLGLGSPGDNAPQFYNHGYEVYEPLNIHLVPEPGGMAIAALAAAAILRRQRSQSRCAHRDPRPEPARSAGGKEDEIP